MRPACIEVMFQDTKYQAFFHEKHFDSMGEVIRYLEENPRYIVNTIDDKHVFPVDGTLEKIKEKYNRTE